MGGKSFEPRTTEVVASGVHFSKNDGECVTEFDRLLFGERVGVLAELDRNDSGLGSDLHQHLPIDSLHEGNSVLDVPDRCSRCADSD